MSRFISDEVHESSWRIVSASIGYGDDFTSAFRKEIQLCITINKTYQYAQT